MKDTSLMRLAAGGLSLWLGIVLIYVTPARGADTPWKAGVSAIKITPQKPVIMSGYASRSRPFERVERDLFAKALALDDGSGHRAVIVTMDLIGLSAAIANIRRPAKRFARYPRQED